MRGVMPEMNFILDITCCLLEGASPKLRVTDTASGTVVRSTQSDSLGRPHLITAILKFDISNAFTKWEQAFYTHQPIARAAGLYELYHGHEPGNDKRVVVVVNCLSEEHMQKFIEANGKAMASSGHIPESTVTEIYIN